MNIFRIVATFIFASFFSVSAYADMCYQTRYVGPHNCANFKTPLGASTCPQPSSGRDGNSGSTNSTYRVVQADCPIFPSTTPSTGACYETIKVASHMSCDKNNSNSADFSTGCTSVPASTKKVEVPCTSKTKWVNIKTIAPTQTHAMTCAAEGMKPTKINGMACASGYFQAKDGDASSINYRFGRRTDAFSSYANIYGTTTLTDWQYIGGSRGNFDNRRGDIYYHCVVNNGAYATNTINQSLFWVAAYACTK